MTSMTRRAITLAIPFFAVQLAACGEVLSPEPARSGPQFLIGNSPIAPFSVAKTPVLETKQEANGRIDRQLVVELDMAAEEADALEQGKRAFESSGSFWLDGAAIALADPRPSPVVGLLGEKDGTRLVVIAMPIDDATWKEIDAAAAAGQTVDVEMDIDLFGIDARGGTFLVHSGHTAGSFEK